MCSYASLGIFGDLSLHAANQALREKIVPSAKSYPIAALMEDCKKYFSITNKKPSFEYTLLGTRHIIYNIPFLQWFTVN
jgi:adenine C2-methylase RlmN of 23S rRNA A2503 and tRNA A37